MDCVKLLLEHPDIDVNAKDHDNVTALYRAIHGGFTECVKLLLKHPNIDVKDASYQALCYDRSEYVETLFNHPNLDSCERDKVGWIRSTRFILCLPDIHLYYMTVVMALLR